MPPAARTPMMAAWVLLLVGLILGKGLLPTAVDPGTVDLGYSAIGCLAALAAVLAFERGDPPRLPWGLRALALGLVLAARLAMLDDNRAAGLGLLIVANVLGAIAMLLLARLFHRSPLTPPWAGPSRALLGVVGLLAVAGVSFAISAIPAEGTRGLYRAAVVVSACSDGIVFVSAAAIAIMLRRMAVGTLAWPYILLAVDGATHLAHDMASALGAGAAPAVTWVVAIAASAGIVAGLLQASLSRGWWDRTTEGEAGD